MLTKTLLQHWFIQLTRIDSSSPHGQPIKFFLTRVTLTESIFDLHLYKSFLIMIKRFYVLFLLPKMFFFSFFLFYFQFCWLPCTGCPHWFSSIEEIIFFGICCVSSVLCLYILIWNGLFKWIILHRLGLRILFIFGIFRFVVFVCTDFYILSGWRCWPRWGGRATEAPLGGPGYFYHAGRAVPPSHWWSGRARAATNPPNPPSSL